MANARKLPSGNWRVRISYTDETTGVRLYESFTAPSKREAERLAAVWNIDRKARKRETEAQGITVEEMLDKYIASCRRRRLKETTIATYIKYKDKSFPTLIDRRIKTLTLDDIQQAIDERALCHSGKTVRNEFCFLVTALGRYCEDLNLSKIEYPPVERQEMQIPDDDAVQKLLSASRENSPDFYIAVLLACVMGLRRSEICALEWDDIDHSAQTLTICKAQTKNEHGDLVISTPKTNAGKRTNFIPDAVYRELLHYRSLDKRMVNLTPDAVTRRYERIREKLGITCRFHDLRHYHASVMLALGVPMKYIVADMGHATPDMVNRVYGHRMKEKERVINGQMDSHATSLLEGTTYDYSVTRNVT